MARLPDYLKRGLAEACDPINKKVRNILKEHRLNTVCDSARCPNKKECYCSGTATFMIMGNICTRNCKFCNIEKSTPLPLEPDEPKNIAKAVAELNLDYCVITSVTRDDLPDCGAGHFASTIFEVKKMNPDVKIEVLTPDFKGSKSSLDTVLNAAPNVFNHNIETVKSFYPKARQMANYKQSLEVLEYVKTKYPNAITKTGIMVGLGESMEELNCTMHDIARTKCDILTIGQYMQPSKSHLSVTRYYKPSEFEELKNMALKAGITYCVSAPLARSSYIAKEAYENAKLASASNNQN